jgi:hypothetical protein
MFLFSKPGKAKYRMGREKREKEIQTPKGVPGTHVAPFSSMAHTVSRLSRVTLSASSTTEVGMAKLDEGAPPAELPLSSPADGVPLALDFLPLTSIPFAADPKGGPAAAAVSCRTSSMTRRSRAGKEVISPERRRDRAWFCTAAGQLDEFAFRE